METGLKTTPEVKAVLARYPTEARRRLKTTRDIIFDVAGELNLGPVEETLKWSEPAYLVKTGSTIRMAWKGKSPEQISIYFHCQTQLLETFRELYPDALDYDGKRAIHLPIAKQIDVAKLQHCLTLALTYQKIKHLPLLGA